MIRLHNDPEAALSRGEQSLLRDKSETRAAQMRAIIAAIGKSIQLTNGCHSGFARPIADAVLFQGVNVQDKRTGFGQRF